MDSEGRIVAINRAAAMLVGQSAAELCGMVCADVLRPRAVDGRPLLAGGWDRSASLPSVWGVPERELTIAGRAGEIRVRATARYRRDAAGRVCGALLSLRSTDRPGGAATGAEVVSTVSHELRAPLTSIKGYTSLLLSRWERLTDDQKRMMLEQIHADADRVTRLMGELLDISRLETGRLALRRQLVDLPALVASVVEKAALAEADLECAVDVPEDLPPLSVDADKLEQVLSNLVENAAKYASPKDIEITARCAEGVVAVSVRDHGDGIPASELPRVFRKFYRGGHGKPSGTGLGLWISRGLVEAHGGRLTAESTPGEGSTFTFTLPLQTTTAAN